MPIYEDRRVRKTAGAKKYDIKEADILATPPNSFADIARPRDT